MLKLRNIGPRDIGDFSLAEGRQDNAIEQPAVYTRSAGLAFCLCVFGEEPLDEVGDGWGLLTGDLRGCRIGAAFDEPEQPPCFLARRLGCPWRAVFTDRKLPERSTAPDTSAIMNDVALGSTALSAYAKALHLGIPDDGLAAIGSGSQSVHRPLRDLVPHIRPHAIPA